jgi:hypothetical protein
MRYAVVIEKADGNYSAYVPDLPGCIATGDTVAAVEAEISMQSASISTALRPTALWCRSQPASLNTSRRKAGRARLRMGTCLNFSAKI